MGRARWAVIPLLVALTAHADAYLDGYAQTDLASGTTTVRGTLTVMLFGWSCTSCIIGLTGTHEIRGGGGTSVKQRNVSGQESYRYILSYPGAPGQCYYTYGRAVENHYNPPLGATGPVIIDDKEFFSGLACVASQPRTCLPDQYDCSSTPIIISLRGDYRLTSALNGVRFDLNADGVEDQVAWTAPGAALAFLALDRNGNGLIDDGSELFGNHTPLSSGHNAATGWDALAEMDDDGDGIVTEADAGWSTLLLWVDADHDGISTAQELKPVAMSPIEGIGIDYRMSGRRDAYGNLFRYQGSILLDHSRRSCYDVVLSALP